MLPVFYILGLPIFVWLGIVLAALILAQILIAKRIIKLSFNLWHRKIIPIVILIVLLFHAWYGLSLYWPHR